MALLKADTTQSQFSNSSKFFWRSETATSSAILLILRPFLVRNVRRCVVSESVSIAFGFILLLFACILGLRICNSKPWS